jgi:hypothetical protein
MSQKKDYRLKNQKFNVFIPLVNLLLFEKFESPDFESEKEKLSDNFIEAIEIINQNIIEENHFFTKRIYYFIKELTAEQREKVCYAIVESDVYIATMTIAYIIEHNLSMDEESTFLSQAEVLNNVFEFRLEAKLSKTIFYFFIFHLEHIMYLKFSDEQNISKTEYIDVIKNLGENENFKYINNLSYKNYGND